MLVVLGGVVALEDATLFHDRLIVTLVALFAAPEGAKAVKLGVMLLTKLKPMLSAHKMDGHIVSARWGREELNCRTADLRL